MILSIIITFIWSQQSLKLRWRPLPMLHLSCLLASPLTLTHEQLLVKLIYENKLVKYLHWGTNTSTLNLSVQVFSRHLRSLSLSFCLRFQMINSFQFDLQVTILKYWVTLVCRINTHLIHKNRSRFLVECYSKSAQHSKYSWINMLFRVLDVRRKAKTFISASNLNELKGKG